MFSLQQPLRKILICLWFLGLSSLRSNAAETEVTQLDFIASVNGVPITQGLFDLNLKAAINQGKKDTPQLRQAIKGELINRTLIAQEAMRAGLEAQLDMRDQIIQLKQSLLLDAFIADYLQKNPITDEMLREEYKKQTELLGVGKNATQYHLSQIVRNTEAEAIAVAARLEAGESFAKVASEVSVDATSKSQGGSIGWVTLNQVATPILEVLPTLSKGGISAPIKVQGTWIIVKVDETRSIRLPTFEASKNQIRQALIQQYLNDTLKQLRMSAKIVE